MNICIFGGAFDPIHNGHIAIAQEAVKRFPIEKLIFMVSKEPPHKQNHIASFQDRYNMVEIAVSDLGEKYCVSDLENRSDGLSYTYKTLTEIKKIYFNDEIFFLVGSDIFADIENWRNWERLFDLAIFIVGYRPGVSFEKMKEMLPELVIRKIDDGIRIKLLDLSSVNVSSSDIRKSFAGFKKNIPARVAEYIEKNKLYKEV
ncbi:MAG: nicotinate-nucleotide adenylyltransferase [Mucispirillum sp.]|nr:nicotinate-nucleotide adenylyltransferase [Mucispirillum sp.]